MKDWHPTPAPSDANALEQWAIENGRSLHDFAKNLDNDDLLPLAHGARREFVERFGSGSDDLILLHKFARIYAELYARGRIAEYDAEAAEARKKKHAPKSGQTSPVSDQDKATAVRLHAKEGYTYREIGLLIGRNERTVGEIIRELCDCNKCERKRAKKNG